MNSYRKIFKKGEAARRKFQISNEQFKKTRFIDDDPENITYQKQKQKYIRPLTQYHKFLDKTKKTSNLRQSANNRQYSPNRRRYFINTPQIKEYPQILELNFKDDSRIIKYNSQIKSQSISISLGRRLKQKVSQNPKNLKQNLKNTKQKFIILPFMPTIKLKLDDNFVFNQRNTQKHPLSTQRFQKKIVYRKNT